MSLSVGIVGFPNVGKSTLFNALLKKQTALAANYPFATIEPNVGIVPVPDSRLARLASVIQSTEGVLPPEVPATVEFVDIAGLVKGASNGEGLGNTFLSHIREATAIVHVLRAFESGDVIRAGAVRPVDDYRTIELELVFADLSTIEKQKAPKGSTDPEEKLRWAVIEKLKIGLDGGVPARAILSSPQEIEMIKDLHLLTAKPELYLLNMDESQLGGTGIVEEFAASASVPVEQCVEVSALLESQLAELSTEEQSMYLLELGIERSGLEQLIQAAYQTLNLQSFYTAGEKEVRAWTIPRGATAVEASGVIHTDFMKKFIRAHVAQIEDFVSLSGWKGCREAGKLRKEGKEYIMQDGDVVEFLIGT